MRDSSAEMWDDFLGSGSPAAAVAVGAPYSTWQFGYGIEMGDRLVALVLSGCKRATTGSLWVHELEGEPLPCVDDFSIVTDGSGVARCVVRTTSVEIVAFDDVDELFAHDEGEGDLSLHYWRDAHWAFFTKELANFGRVPQLDMPAVCEHFEVVFPTSSEAPI